jgi:hypothetical protein
MIKVADTGQYDTKSSYSNIDMNKTVYISQFSWIK